MSPPSCDVLGLGDTMHFHGRRVIRDGAIAQLSIYVASPCPYCAVYTQGSRMGVAGAEPADEAHRTSLNKRGSVVRASVAKLPMVVFPLSQKTTERHFFLTPFPERTAADNGEAPVATREYCGNKQRVPRVVELSKGIACAQSG